MQATKTNTNSPHGFGRKGPDTERKGIFSRGPIGFVVIGVHVVLIWALLATMGIVELPGLAKPMEAVIIESPVEQKSEPVKVVKPDLEQPVIETPPIVDTIPEIEVPVDEPAPAAITAETSPAPPVQETANMTVSRRVDPVYPPGSRRDGEQGTGMYPRARRREGQAEGRAGVEEQRLPATRRSGDGRHS